MTGVAWILLLIGVVFMIGSFFVTEKLSPSELNQIAELSEEELKRIIDRGLKNAETRIEDAIDEQVDQSSEKVDRSLEKVTNDKIMAISEYSDTVIESMNKTHNEIMFLYSMLNDKHTELTGMAADLQRLAADVRSLEEKAPLTAPQAAPERAVHRPGGGFRRAGVSLPERGHRRGAGRGLFPREPERPSGGRRHGQDLPPLGRKTVPELPHPLRPAGEKALQGLLPWHEDEAGHRRGPEPQPANVRG